MRTNSIDSTREVYFSQPGIPNTQWDLRPSDALLSTIASSLRANPCEKPTPKEVQHSKPSHNVTTAALSSDRVVTFPVTSGNFPAEQSVILAEIRSMQVFRDTIAVCEAVFRILEAQIPDPVRVWKGDDFAFRYKEQTPQIVVVQKLSRIVTGLRACLVLLENGLYQEVGALFRMLKEFDEDVQFMCEAIRSGRLTELQERFMSDFFQPEFDHENPFLATQSRNRVPRRQIQAALARIPENPMNPSDAQESARSLTNTYSGYVHGASEHILDMCAGDPPRYQLAGMRGTRRQNEFEGLAWDYFYRALLDFMWAAGAFGPNELLGELYAYRNYLEKISGKTEWESPEELLRALKQANT